MIQIQIEWILAVIATLSATIATISGIMWNFMQSRLSAQDKLIDSQRVVIEKLQEDVERMSKGCGHQDCLWKHR